MFKFGKNPPRLLECFGVSGLLDENCQVYYDNIFNTRHIGQVSDLLVAKLSHFQVDELRLRSLLLAGVSEAYRSQVNTGQLDEELRSIEPLVLECGADDEKIAIGVVFSSGHGLETSELAARVASGKPNGSFEAVLVAMHSVADRLLIRIVPNSQVELVALLGLPGKMDISETTQRPPPEVIVLEQDLLQDAPKASRYTELGDLDYAALLAADEPGREQPGSPTGQILAEGCTELADALRFRSRSGREDSVVRVGGRSDNGDSGEVIRISGSGTDQVDGARQLVRGTGSELGSDRFVVSGGGSEDDDLTLAESVRKKGFRGIFKKVWPFKKGDADEDATSAESADNATEIVQAAEAKASLTPPKSVSAKGKKVPAEVEAAEGEEENPNLEAAANNLIVEIQDGSLDRTLSRAQEEMAEIKNEMQTGRAKRWVDGLMGDLMAEKARLHDLAKKLNTTIRQKEIEFRNKEQLLQEEVRRRDEMLRQKNNALTRAKEQLAQSAVTMEKLKAANQERSEESNFKAKYSLVQKMLLSSKEEGARLTAKLDDAKAQLATLQMLNKKRPTAGGPELTLMKSKNERLTRLAEELHNMNEQLKARVMQLTERVEAKAPAGGAPAASAASVEVLKKRFEAAMRLTSASQKESTQLKGQTQQLQLRVEELEREEARLNMELARSQGDLKRAEQAVRGRGGGGGRGSPNEAA